MTPIAHSAIGILGWQKPAFKKNIKTLFLFILISNLPDIDFIWFMLYGKARLQLHQSYTHNIFFVGFFTLLLFMVFKTSKERLILIMVSSSHLLLDVIIIDRVSPVGIRIFFPVSTTLFNLGFFPNFLRGNFNQWFSWHNLITIFLEIIFFILPVLWISWKNTKQLVFNKEFWKI